VIERRGEETGIISLDVRTARDISDEICA
jgi:hypothetical protein